MSEASILYRHTHRLMYLGSDGSLVYTDELDRLSRDIFRRCNKLYDSRAVGSTPEEEAFLCLSLLWGYTAVPDDDGDKDLRIQHILDRCWSVLPSLPASLLKVRLLTHCYGEVYDPELASEARSIIRTWDASRLTPEQSEIISLLECMEENPYPAIVEAE